MQVAPFPDAQETRDNQCFEALLWALSRPGHIRHLPEQGVEQIIAALLDRECSVFASDTDLSSRIAQSGASLVRVEEADYVFSDAEQAGALLPALRIGSDLYPDDGACLIVQAGLGDGPAVRLSGPGVDGVIDLQISGLAGHFWQSRARSMRYPQGFELIFVDGDRVVAVPRSSIVEVL